LIGQLHGKTSAPAQIISSLKKLDAWIEEHAFRGWDPHDALNSPLIRRLTRQNRAASIFCLQLLKRSPINFRTVLGIERDYNPKGMGLFLATYLRKYAATSSSQCYEIIKFLVRWLLEHGSLGYQGAAWGYNFDWPNRNFFAPRGTPTIVNTAFVAHAFLDCHVLFRDHGAWSTLTSDVADFAKMSSNCRSRYSSPLDVARSACDFVMQDLRKPFIAADELCFSYTPLDTRLVHNASMLGACLLARVFMETREKELERAALAAARFTARRQLSDGSWWYGEARNDRWVDNFHTGFVLVALKRVAECLETCEFDQNLLRGYQYWKQNFFMDDGAPKYYAERTYPIDIHSVAQAILTFLEFQNHDADATDRSLQEAQYGINEFQDVTGYFYYQKHRLYTIRIPYMRWSQAWMQHALSAIVY
jgi:hypothetical protein